jgi:hypothetical protein
MEYSDCHPPPLRPVSLPIGFQPTASQAERVRDQLPLSSASNCALVSTFAQNSAGAPSPPRTVSLGKYVLPEAEDLADMTTESLNRLRLALEETIRAVEKELGDRKLCTICCEGLKEVIFYPCKHKCVCQKCCDKLDECPLCRKKIEDKIVPFEA